MSEYIPDKWVIVDYGQDYIYEDRYAVLAGWWGNFVTSDSWKRSSPLVKWEIRENEIHVRTFSGSVYKLHKGTEGVTMLTQSLINQASLTVIDEWEKIIKIAKENSDV